MSPRTRTPESRKFLAHRSLFIVGESPLSHSPGHLVMYAVNHPESSLEGHSPRYSVRNPENYSDGHPAGYRAGYAPENPESYSEGRLDSNSAECRDNRPERNRESNREDNWAGNSLDCSESNSADSPTDCPASFLPGFRNSALWYLTSNLSVVPHWIPRILDSSTPFPGDSAF